MPRSVQAFKQNAKVTNSPANVNNGDPSSAIDDGSDVFKIPPTLDVCAPVTGGTRNPFLAGLNDMGGSTGNSTGVAGQTGNIMSGTQIFADSLCGYALGGGTTREVIAAWRHIREQGDNPREVYRAVRRLRTAAGAGTTPQSVLAGVQAITNITNTNPATQNAIAVGQAAAGISGNQIIDTINGSQTMANQGHQLLTGKTTTTATGTGLLSASGAAINQNTAKHVGHQSIIPATAVNLTDQNLLVEEDFANSYSVSTDPDGNWTWDGTDGAPGTNVLGCLSVTCNGNLHEFVSSEIPVVAGESIEVACEYKTVGLTYAGTNPIVLAVEKYRKTKTSDGATTYADVGGYDVDPVVSPAGSADWKGIAGIYVVEPGVDQLRFKFKIHPNAAAGTVKFDAASFLKLDLIADAAVPGVGMTVDNVVSNLYGTAGSGFTHNQEAVAFANTAASLASVTAKTGQLAAEGNTGAVAGDDFNWAGSILSNTNWSGSYTTTDFGTYQSDGSKIAWSKLKPFETGISDCHFIWVGTDSVSTIDYQLIQATLSSPPEYASSAGVTGVGYLYLFGRVSSDFHNYIKLKIGGDGTYQVIRCVSSTETVMDSGTCSVPGAGAVVSLYCGDKPSSATRLFKAEIGSAVISNFTESSTASQLGASYRGWGWGGLCNKWAAPQQLSATTAPPSLNQWLAQDQ